MPKNPITVKTIVTTDIIKKIAEKYGVELIEVLTGFKFIGEQIGILEKQGEEDRFTGQSVVSSSNCKKQESVPPLTVTKAFGLR